MKIYQSESNTLNIDATGADTEKVIVKINGVSTQADKVEAIATPASATAETCATTINSILTALKAAGIMGE